MNALDACPSVGFFGAALRRAAFAFWAVAGLTTVSTAALAASVTVDSPPPAYQPFDLRVTFNAGVCLSPTYPLFGDVSYKDKVLTITLSHLKTGVCELTRTVRVPGLPPGFHDIVVQVTKGASATGGAIPIGAPPFGSNPSSQDSYTTLEPPFAGRIEIAELFSTVLATYRDDEPSLVSGAIPPEKIGMGAIVLGSGALTALGNAVKGDWLEPNAGYTFRVYGLAQGMSIPDDLVPLRLLKYPLPLKGVFATTDAATADRLANEWGNNINANGGGLVGKLSAGSCPIGMSPVYQAFHPVAIAHRYTQSNATYRMLIANGYKGDGAVFCAPSR
jgi:hypothetical protein